MTTVSEIFETMAYGPAPESDKPALEWIARQNGAFGLFLGGRLSFCRASQRLDIPSTGSAKHREDAVAFASAFDHVAVVALDARPDHGVVAHERLAHRLRITLPQPGTAFNVGHEKRDHAIGQGARGVHVLSSRLKQSFSEEKLVC